MDTNSYEQLPTMQATIQSNRKESDEKWRSSQNTPNQWSYQPLHQLWVILTFLNPNHTRRVHQRLIILPLWYRLNERSTIGRWKFYKNWWHVDSQTWYHLTKILWTPHQDRTQRRHCSGPQELIQLQQDVSQCHDLTSIRPSSWFSSYQKILWAWRILHKILWSPFLLL